MRPMFIRRAKTRTTQSGADYFSYRLVESARDGAKVRQRTLLNLGSSFPVPEADWPAFCQRVESLLSKQGELVDHDLSMEAETEAQRIADQLLARRSEAETPGAKSSQDEPAKRADFRSVDMGSLELVRPRSVGVEQVGLWAMEQVGLPALLERLGLGAKVHRRQIRAWPPVQGTVRGRRRGASDLLFRAVRREGAGHGRVAVRPLRGGTRQAV